MGQILTGLKSDSVIIYAKVSGVWMGNVYSDQWNPCCTDFVCDRRRDSLIDLELDDQVNLLSDKFLGIPHCCLRVVVVVQNLQIYSRRVRRCLQALSHSLRERHLG